MDREEYTPPILTVDCIIFELIDGKLHVLLVRRTHDPFIGQWVLPGGYSNAGETTREALRRVVMTKAGVDTNNFGLIEQLYTFDTIARDPRGHAVSVTYMGLGKDIKHTTSTTTQTPKFVPVDELPELAFDHNEIIAYAHQRLESKISYTNAVFALLPEEFTLSQLQQAYQAIMGRELDKRNFRKKFLSLNLIQATDKMFQDGAHRPARMYRFNQQQLETLTRSFE